MTSRDQWQEKMLQGDESEHEVLWGSVASKEKGVQGATGVDTTLMLVMGWSGPNQYSARESSLHVQHARHRAQGQCGYSV